MKLIRNVVIIDVNEGEKILINTLNGRIHLLERKNIQVFDTWRKCETITPRNDCEKDFYGALLKGGYLIQDDAAEISLKNKITSALREKHVKQRTKFSILTFVLTYDCNFRCPYCYELDSVTYGKTMTKEMIDAAFELAGENLNIIGLFGGEPLLAKNRQLIEYIFERGCEKRFQIATNGYTLLNYVNLLEKHKIEFLQVTIDGPENIHNNRRFLADGSPTYRRILKGIEECLLREVPIHIRMNADKLNLEQCKELQDELTKKWEKHEDYLSFEIAPLFQLKAEDHFDVVKALCDRDYGKSFKELTKSNNILKTFRPITNYFLCGEEFKPAYTFCHANGGNVLVDPFGDIYSCILALGKEEWTVGKYYPEKTLKENSVLMRTIDEIAQCKKCEYALLCGGCPLKLKDDSGDAFRPRCSETRGEIHNLIPYLYNKKTRLEKF